jgi:hypothetical protein
VNLNDPRSDDWATDLRTTATSETAEAGATSTGRRDRARRSAMTAEGTAGASIQAPDIALAHGCVPDRLDLTGHCVGCNAVVDAEIASRMPENYGEVC